MTLEADEIRVMPGRPGDPWPDVIVVGGVPYWHGRWVMEPTMKNYEKHRHWIPNWDDFAAWCDHIQSLLDVCEDFITTYSNDDGEKLWFKRCSDV